MCEMDTDSLYLALSGSSLDEVIIPEKRALTSESAIYGYHRNLVTTHITENSMSRQRLTD